MKPLTPRLKSIASFVRSGDRVADIGTDHGYIPAYLIKNGICDSAIATDIGEGPLRNAMKTAMECDISDKISFICTDGLIGIDKDSADTVIIAGMGGETMMNILSSSPWAMEKGRRLILQPQSKIDELCDFLGGKCCLTDAALVYDEGKHYLVMELCGGESDEKISPEKLLLSKHDPLLPDYIDMTLNRLRPAYDGAAGGSNEDRKKLLCEKIRYYETLKGETKKWQM